MPPRPRPWFRFYSEAADSLKVHELPDRLVKPWLIMLCLANTNTPRGRLPSPERVAFKLRVKEEKAKAFIAELVTRHFIDYDGGHYVMHEWDDWQKDRDVAPSLRDGKRDDNHANSDESVRKITLDKEGEREKEKDGDPEADKDGARTAIHPDLDLSEEPPFALEYIRRYEIKNARPPSPNEKAAARALERDFGTEACRQIAADHDWLRHPNWLRSALNDPNRGKRNVHTEPDLTDSPFAGIGQRVGAG